jgi:hypothetical protein
MQAPCIVLAILARNYYGIDVYMQFIVFGTIAISVIDIIHVRVNMIMGLTRLVNGVEDKRIFTMPTRLDVFVYFTFLAMNLVISLPILYKLKQMNTNVNGFVAACVIFYAHILQRGVLLLMRFIRKHPLETSGSLQFDEKATPEEKQRFITQKDEMLKQETEKRNNYLYGDNNDVAFEVNLVVQMFASTVVFAVILTNPWVTA